MIHPTIVSLLLTTTVLMVLPQNTPAQELRTNDKGEKIIVYPDGSWRYFNDPFGNNTLYDKHGNPIPVEAQVLADQPEVPVPEQEVLLSEEAYRKLVVSWRDKRRQLAELSRQLAEAAQTRKQVRQQLILLRSSEHASRREKKKAEEAFEAAKARYEELSSQMRALRQEVNALEKLLKSDPKKWRVWLAEDERKLLPLESADASPPTVKVYARYQPERDVMLHPPRPPCRFLYEGKDRVSGTLRRDVAPQLFFSHTPEPLRQIMHGRNYLEAWGRLAAITGGYRFLVLEIRVASKAAPQAFGHLPKGSRLDIVLLDGRIIRLVNNVMDRGKWNEQLGAWVYAPQYNIDAQTEKKLRHAEVDRVRVYWSSGYEDYEVFELDFFRNQFECLDKKTE